MADFIGATVVITLVHPVAAKVRGHIVSIKEQRLILGEVSWLHNGTCQESLAVEGNNVLDLDIEPEVPPAPSVSYTGTTVDPAILSFARSSTPGQVSVISQVEHQPGLTSDASQPPVSPVHSFNSSGALDIAEPSAILTEPFDELSLKGCVNGNEINDLTEKNLVHRLETQNGINSGEKAVGSSQQARGKRGRRKNAGGKGNKAHALEQTHEPLEDNPATIAQSMLKTNRNPGWSESSLKKNSKPPDVRSAQLQQDVETSSLNPEFLTSTARNRKKHQPRRRQKPCEQEAQNGWATGEATDIQDLGDFDFEENHKRFDKQKVFEQIRRDDTTADEERLISFNRLPARPGTYGGKNLHYTENVLESPTRKIRLSSDDDSGADESTKDRARAPRRLSSRASERNVPSRKGGALMGSDGQGATPGNLPEIRENRPHRATYEDPLSSNPSLRSHKSPSQQQRNSLRTAASHRSCRCVTPLQMLELEHLAMSELGMTEDVLIENGATAIAQTARKMAIGREQKLRREKRGLKILTPTPLIVVLAGNHRTGSRAIAAARQLRNHDAKVLLCVMGLEREIGLLDNVRRQVSTYRKCGGLIVGQSQLMETLNEMHVSNGNQSVRQLTNDIIIDALLGMHLAFEDLRMEDQIAYSQLVQWVNMCDVTTISIDVPSGVDASTGKTPDSSHCARLKAEASRTGVILQGDPGLVIEAHHVLSLGAPKIGLLHGKETVTGFQNHYSWLVADIGLDESVWKKSGLCAGRGINFGSDWVTKLDLTPSSKH